MTDADVTNAARPLRDRCESAACGECPLSDGYGCAVMGDPPALWALDDEES